MQPPATPRRGEIYWVDLNPVIGSEQGNRRPCLIVSPDALNRIARFNTVTVVPITSQGNADATRLPVSAGEITGFAIIHQVRSLDKRRLEKLAGHVSSSELQPVLVRLQQYFT